MKQIPLYKRRSYSNSTKSYIYYEKRVRGALQELMSYIYSLEEDKNKEKILKEMKKIFGINLLYHNYYSTILQKIKNDKK